MNKTQKIIIILFILAILFSVFSIVISLDSSIFKIPKSSPPLPKSEGVEISFYVEENNLESEK